MAGVLDTLASYVTNMLTEMAKEEVAMLIGVSGEIDKLGVKLSDLKNFLADADRRNITDSSVQAWVEELKRAMYDVTDILDLCQLKVMEQGPSKDMGCLNPLVFCLRNPLHAHDIGTRIKALNEKLDDICTRGRSFDFIKLEAYQDRRMTQPPVVNRKTDPVLERSAVVGERIEEDTGTLVEMLTKDVAQESSNIMVFAIVGVGGIGKTTLTKKVFNNEAIQRNFAKKIWLSITQEFYEVDLLRTAIIAAEGNMPGSGGGLEDKSLLVPALTSAIKDKKFFLVLDDMWGDNEWNNLLKAPFSHGAPGSRVLVTTRHDTVARGMKAIVPYHHVEKLGPEDSWSLLKKQVLTCDKGESDIDGLKDIGLQIIAKCDGLPLAVKVMGGLLCRREKHWRDWEDVLNDARWPVSQMPEELNYAIYISYEDLPPGLKQCFLHFSLKPKNTVLDDDKLVAMWISEGFVHGDSDRLEKLGKEYYKELIFRNLIEPSPGRLSQYVSNMHDVVRSFAQFVARDEALTAHKGGVYNVQLSSQRFLRLSIENKGVASNDFEWRSLQVQKSLRTLFLVGNLKIESGDSLISFSSLRVLHIEFTTFGTLLESLYQLKHLRYLAVQYCNDMDRLPENIDKVKLLQHISLEGCESFLQLPSSIVKLPGLRYLNLNLTCVNNVPRGFGALTNLRFLNGFPSYMDGDWCSLEELAPLSLLEDLLVYDLENIIDSSFAAKASLGAKVHLTTLGLFCVSRLGQDGLVEEIVSEEEERVIQEVFDELCPLPCLEYLHIRGYFGRQLPRWMMLAPPKQMPLSNLRNLILEFLPCCTQLPDSLCHIQCLEYLEVYQAPAIVHVGPEFVHPPNHHHFASSQAVAAFPRLHEMVLNGMVEWEEWEWEEEVPAMPALEELRIMDCKLRCIPPGLAFHARSLKRLTLWSIEGLESLENIVSVVELDLYDNPYLTRISNFPKLQKLEIDRCPMVELLHEMSALHRLVLKVFYYKKQLPSYLQAVNPSHLVLDCSPKLLASMSAGKSGSEWDKFSHIQHVEAYADEEENDKKWQMLYTSEPYSMETNIHLKEEWSESEEEFSEDEDEEDVDENEEEHTGHELQEGPDEIVPSGSGGLFRSSDEDKGDLNNNQDKGEDDLERRKED